ncbi:hypothetical protein L246_34675, partial [Salmonella enterica subsp. enterica serovar Worthington str. BCH-5715]
VMVAMEQPITFSHISNLINNITDDIRFIYSPELTVDCIANSKFWAVNETNVISNIINEVRNMGEGNGGYGTANYNQAIINSEAISSKVKYSGTTIYNHSGGTITVVGANT